MKKIWMGLTLTIFIFVILGCSPTDPDITTSIATTLDSTTSLAPGTYSLAELQEDYDDFIDMMEINPNLFTDQAELAELVETQRSLLYAGMTQRDFYRVVAVVAAGIRCGHTMFRIPELWINDLFEGEFAYPISVRLFAGHLRVVEVTGDTALELGDEITAIDGMSIADLTSEMMRYISADGDGSTVKTAALSASYFSYYLLFLAEDELLEVNYLDHSSGTPATETIDRSTVNTHHWVHLPPFESAFTEDYALLTVREFYPYGANTLSVYYAFFETFFTKVAADGIEHIVLDIRGNGGGDPMVTSRLFSYLATTSQPYFRSDAPDFYLGLKANVPLSEPHFNGTLYTLIDGFCFSSTGHFASLLKYQEVGLFIGEETNGSFVCSDSSIEFILSNTELTFRTSTAVWGVQVTGFEQGRGVFPDISVSMTYEDYMAGIDPVMDRAISLIHGGE